MQSLQDARFTLTGVAKPLSEADQAAAREAFLATHPNAFYVDFGDFRWFRVEDLTGGRFIGGFGRVASVSAAGVWTGQAADDTAGGLQLAACGFTQGSGGCATAFL